MTGGRPLDAFSAPTRAWFSAAFEAPTDAQSGAWRAVASGEDALVVAPTGSGKTLAAFLWSIDRLITAPLPDKKQRLRVLYISPLKALAVDVERNLRSPLTGIEAQAARLGVATSPVRVGVRTGDTPAEDRRRMLTTPPDILITTPESLFLLLTSQAREALAPIEAVIIDEVHAVAGTKRGAHLAVSLERLDELLARPAQRIGLSATVKPTTEVARFLSGGRPVTIVESSTRKELEISVVVPVEDMTEPAAARADADVEERTSIWPAVEERLVEHIRAHRSTIVFCNSRRLAERLCARINEAAGETIARAHHGSVAREQRLLIEEDLKSGRLPCVVATSSLELGIDMGAVDLVIQIESPASVASGLQRIGRAGHHVGVPSRGVIFPKFRGDLLECAVVAERMAARDIESTRVPRNPLDVLAQHVVSMVSMDPWTLEDLESLVRRAASFADLPRSALESVLDMLTGRYPSDAFAELRPRVTWDRVTNELRARPGAQRLAVTSGGTIPDRGLFGVHLASDGTKVGELDEEMVYESRAGETFVLGASTWRIEDITRDRVIVSPAPGEPGKMPFWHGDAPGRPIELGRALGAFIRETGSVPDGEALARAARAGLDDAAARNLLAYLREQRDATGVLPDDRTIVVERFRDELGDWRLCVHSPFGARVHAPWSLAIEARVRERLGVEAQTIYSDDGIVVRLPEADEAPPAADLLLEPDEIEDLVVEQVSNSALFASRFREAAVRSLLIPRRRPGQRTPLWQQRQRSADLLSVASGYGEFPVVLEAYRECLQDVFDLPALVELLAQIQRREVSVVEVETQMPSPFASSLTFGYVGAFIYEGDAPLAERRAAALTLDRRILSELLGQEELRDLVDAAALGELELLLQRLTPERAFRDVDDLHDALLSLGDLTIDEMAARGVGVAEAKEWLEELVGTRRALLLRVAGEDRYAAIEDAARFRDALGTALPPGVPEAFLAPVAAPLEDLVSRFARTHGPFGASDVAARLGIGPAVVEQALQRLQASGRVVLGAFRPGGSEREWIDAEVLRILRRKSLAAFRREVEPVEPGALARFLPVWHGVGGRRGGMDALLRAIDSLQGAPIPASALERQVLGARGLGSEAGRLLDELLASGEVAWTGAGALGPSDGWVVLASAEQAHLLLPDEQPGEPSAMAARVASALADRGALFFRQIVEAVGSLDDREVIDAIWELVWSGRATNDTMHPLRALTGRASRAAVRSGRRRARPPIPARLGPPTAAGRWSLLPPRAADRTVRSYAVAEQVLRRNGIVTRGTVAAERLPGGFAAAYQVLKAFEERGRCRRGYFVEGLGGAQFALPGAVDRLRAIASDRAPGVHVLAAADPANPFGAVLPWPSDRSGHRPARKAGATVAIVDGSLVLYLEKGGRSLLTFTDDAEQLGRAAAGIGDAVRAGVLGTVSVEKADGAPLPGDGPLVEALRAAGAVDTPKGLRLRAPR